MLFSNTDLYKGEWLDLVFKNRNRNYGAYTLRRENDNLLLKAIGGTFLAFAIFGVTVTVIARSKEMPPVVKPTIINITPPDDLVYEVPKEKKVEQPKQDNVAEPQKQSQAAAQTAVQEFKQMVVAPNELAEDPKPLVENVSVGSTEVKGEITGEINATSGQGDKWSKGIDDGAGTGGDDGGVKEVYTVQVMPEPVGGMDAWNKFLQKTLRYPIAAQENGISGKTFMSFIIEKDGTISNIEVVRKAGSGFDEESLRVLKLAKPWKPGMQNGKAVRVRYVLPINFQVEAN